MTKAWVGMSQTNRGLDIARSAVFIWNNGSLQNVSETLKMQVRANPEPPKSHVGIALTWTLEHGGDGGVLFDVRGCKLGFTSVQLPN